MGRGLSTLQNTLITLAYERRLKAEEPGVYPDLTAHAAIVKVYGFPEAQGWYIDRSGKLRGHDFAYFDPELIGRERYQAAAAAVSRAITRLVERGLARRCHRTRPRGFLLTDAGMQLGAQLSVKLSCHEDNLTDRTA